MKIKLKNTSSVTLWGKLPGTTFNVDADDDGRPVDAYWRARLDEEAKLNVGAVTVVPAVVAVVQPEPAPAGTTIDPNAVASTTPPTSTDAAAAAKSTKGKA